MSKRFKLDIGDDYSFIDDIIQDETYTIYNDRFKEVWGQKIVDLLNVMNDTLLEQAKQVSKLSEENEQLKQEIKQYWKCRDKWKQEAKELKKEADYFERKKCEYWNMYNEAHLDRIILKKENKELRQKLDFYLLDEFEWKEKYGD